MRLHALANYDASVDLGIAGKVALVTAGTRGIGLGIANALAAEGVRVAVAARTKADVERTAAALHGAGIVADLLTEAGCRRALSETEQSLGPIDILVNNLGVRAGSSRQPSPATSARASPRDQLRARGRAWPPAD